MSAGAQGAAPWTLGDFRVWDHQPKGRSGWERKQPKNKPTRAEEGNRWRLGGALQSSCLGSASSHCGHQRATATVEQSTGQLPRRMPTAGQGQQARPPPGRALASQQPGCLASGTMMNPEQDCAQRAATAALGEVLPGSREKRPRGGLTTLPNPALPAGMNGAGQDTKTQQDGEGAHSTQKGAEQEPSSGRWVQLW